MRDPQTNVLCEGLPESSCLRAWAPGLKHHEGNSNRFSGSGSPLALPGSR